MVMPLIVESVKVLSYKTIISEQELNIDPKITVLVGGNETGKTNVLQAISKFSLENKFELEDVSRSSNRYNEQLLPNISILFSLSEEDRRKLAEISPIFRELNRLEICKRGNNLDDYHVIVPKEKTDQFSLKKASLEEQISALVREIEDATQHRKEINREQKGARASLRTSSRDRARAAVVASKVKSLQTRAVKIAGSITSQQIKLHKARAELSGITEKMKGLKNGSLILDADKTKRLLQALPTIYLVEKIEFLPEETPISSLISKPSTGKNKVVVNLLKLGGINNLKILQEKSRRRTVALRRARRLISTRLSEIWKQEKIDFQISATEDILRVNLEEPISISAPPEERSEGFKWFLSFFAEFSVETQKQLKDTLILLDDPAIYLHPKGQKDLLTILEGVGENNQVIYTTHSPFLINKNFPGRTRLLTKEDKGTIINNKPYSNGKLRFWEPLRSAIGVSLGDSLFLGIKNLIVEGVSDQIILTGFNQKLAAVGNSYIDLEKIAIVAAMGGDSTVQVAIFASSEGLSPIILLDNDKKGNSIASKIERAQPQLKKKIIMVNTSKEIAQTIEDLIPVEDYLKALNSAYSRIKNNFEPITEEILTNKKTQEIERGKSKRERQKISIVQLLCEKFEEMKYGDLDKVLVAKELINTIQPQEVKEDKYDNLKNLFSKIRQRFQDE